MNLDILISSKKIRLPVDLFKIFTGTSSIQVSHTVLCALPMVLAGEFVLQWRTSWVLDNFPHTYDLHVWFRGNAVDGN